MPARSRLDTIPTLTSALELYRVEELKALARLVTSVAPSRKQDLVGAIDSALTGSGLGPIVGRLDPQERSALAEAAHRWAGEYREDAFVAKYGGAPDLGNAGAFGAVRPSLLRLFFHPVESRRNLRLPEDLCGALREIIPAPVGPMLETADEPPDHIDQPVQQYEPEGRRWETRYEQVPLELRVCEIAARHDLGAVLALVDAGRLSVTEQKRQPTAASVGAVAAVLQGGDFYDDVDATSGKVRRSEDVGSIRAFAWPMLLQASGLARRFGTKLRLTPAGRAAMSGRNPADVLRKLWNSWSASSLLDEFSRIEAIRGQSGQGRRGMTSPAGRRAEVAAVLADCPPGRWVSVDEFWRYARASEYDFEITHDLWSLYISEKRYGSLGYAGYGKWEYLQGRYILALLFEYAATLGMIDVGYIPPEGARPDYFDIWGSDDLTFLSRYDGLLWFRLTGLGAYCLGVPKAPIPSAPEAPRTLRVLPNLEVAALNGATVPPGERLLLDRFGQAVSERVWRLDRERILAAIEEGHSVASLREILEGRNEGPLPQPVIRFLEDIQERAGKLRDAGAARLIDCGDPAVAALLSTDPATRNVCLPAGTQFVAVRAGKEAAFRKAVRRLGFVLPGAATP